MSDEVKPGPAPVTGRGSFAERRSSDSSLITHHSSLNGRVLPLGPPVGEVLPLPDRHLLLERVDGEPAGGEGVGPVRRADGHRDADLAYPELAEPVDQR